MAEDRSEYTGGDNMGRESMERGNSHPIMSTDGPLTDDSEDHTNDHALFEYSGNNYGQAPVIENRHEDWSCLTERSRLNAENSGALGLTTEAEGLEEKSNHDETYDVRHNQNQSDSEGLRLMDTIEGIDEKSDEDSDIESEHPSQDGSFALNENQELVNGIPLRKLKNPRTWACPRCFHLFTRKKNVEIHWKGCIEIAGNPQNLRYDDKVVAAPYNPLHALYNPYSKKRLARRTTKKHSRVQKEFVIKEYKHGNLIRVQRGPYALQPSYVDPPFRPRSASCPADPVRSADFDSTGTINMLELPKGWAKQEPATRARRRRASTEHTLLAEDSLPAETSIAAGDENEIEDSDEHMTDNNGEQSEPEGSDEHMTGCSP